MAYKLNDLMPLGILVMTSIILLSIGAEVLSTVQEEQCASGYVWNTTTERCVNTTGQWNSGEGETWASNATNYGSQGVGELTSWYPTITLVIAASIVIGTLLVAFAIRR